MNTTLWIIQGLLGALFTLVGVMKTVVPKEKLVARQGWAEDFSPSLIKLIGILEFLGGVGLVVPLATGIFPWLTPLAAVGLALTMLGAALTHLRRHEYSNIIANLLLLLLAVFIAYGRFIVLPA
jgi:uncharacterized membrane protein YphA (DoxX/SURF4 family)